MLFIMRNLLAVLFSSRRRHTRWNCVWSSDVCSSDLIAKFKKFCDPEIPWIKNITEFANEELQTDVWGRIQFGLLAIALFGGLFIESANNPDFIFYWLMQAMPTTALIFVIYACLAFYLVLGGYSIRDAIDYSEAKIKKFREKLKTIKNQ